MNIWRLIAHHKDPEQAIEEMKASNRIAIGWSEIGDLNNVSLQSASELTTLISKVYPDIKNAHLGGPSLWNLYYEMNIGDYVIINAYGKKNCVFEIVGPYVYESGHKKIVGYAHQRPAILTGINADELGIQNGSNISDGQNIRWTLVSCQVTKKCEDIFYKEGLRYSVSSTVVERNPLAREKCLSYYGHKCAICDFDFESVYGDLGKNFIHVHHRIDISLKEKEYSVDPINDLIPICPNCHSMVHKEKPSIEIDKLKKIIIERKSKLG